MSVCQSALSLISMNVYKRKFKCQNQGHEIINSAFFTYSFSLTIGWPAVHSCDRYGVCLSVSLSVRTSQWQIASVSGTRHSFVPSWNCGIAWKVSDECCIILWGIVGQPCGCRWSGVSNTRPSVATGLTKLSIHNIYISSHVTCMILVLLCVMM